MKDSSRQRNRVRLFILALCLMSLFGLGVAHAGTTKIGWMQANERFPDTTQYQVFQSDSYVMRWGAT